MPLTPEMKDVAEKLFAKEIEKINAETGAELQRTIVDAHRRNILQSGIYLGNRVTVERARLKKVCEARANSYVRVLKEAGKGLEPADVEETVAAVSELASRIVENSTQNMIAVLKAANSPLGPEWAKGNLETAKTSAIATIRRDLLIEQDMQKIRPAPAAGYSPQCGHGRS